MKKAINSKGEKESLLIKLDKELENLNKSKEELRNKEAFYIVPYKYILCGKNLLKDSGLFRLTSNFANNTPISLSQKSKISIEAAANPTRYYETHRVCYQCYQVYSFFMKNFNRPQYKKVVKKPLPKQLTNCYESEIGFINKDNLNDLLLDISYYKVSRKNVPSEKVRNLYASQIEFNASKSESMDNSKISHSNKPSNSFENAEGQFNLFFPNKIRRKKRVLSKVAQYYIGKPRLVSRLTFKT